MNVHISTHDKSLILVAKTCVVSISKDMKHSCVDLRFNNETHSRAAFSQLKEIGLQCYHAGNNAPGGAAVMVYANNNDFKLKIRD